MLCWLDLTMFSFRCCHRGFLSEGDTFHCMLRLSKQIASCFPCCSRS